MKSSISSIVNSAMGIIGGALGLQEKLTGYTLVRDKGIFSFYVNGEKIKDQFIQKLIPNWNK